MVEKRLHSKYASPANLSMALTELVGDFTVELRQNVYNIRSAKDFNMFELLQSCERVSPRARSANQATRCRGSALCGQ
ncbi:hypothetical protein GGS24DRAFT_485994 [Hypoxylon argillaceum]|nr:hypothetical protein GGS24DRAFT_485994 [Hypoxylon argillaceum]KAI1145054.1 hypothetical protein F4825DRAFT_444844 [Nemania diffusa]